MRFIFLLTTLAAMPQATAVSQNPTEIFSTAPIAADRPVLQIGLFSYEADGRQRASVTTGPDPGQTQLKPGSYVHAGPNCTMGASSIAGPDSSEHAWRLSGQVVEAGSQQAIVELTSQRVRRDGQTVSEPPAVQRLVLNVGQPVVLEQFTLDPTSTCTIAKIALEARFGPTWMGRGGVAGGVERIAGGGRGGGVGGGGVVNVPAGAASGSSGGAVNVSTGVSSGAGGGASSGARSGIGMGSGSGGGRGGSGTSVAFVPLYDVDLWLVHKPAGGDEEIIHGLLRIDRAGGSFRFAPVTIAGPQGTATVQIGATIALPTDAAGQTQLVFTTVRTVQFVPAGRPPRDPVSSSGITTSPVPGPTDVLAFEMPDIKVPGGPSLDDKFSVRVRFTPRR